MTATLQNQPAYLLHSRPYRESSLLLECFTQDHGRITAIIKGARGPRSKYRGILQLFKPILLSWRAKTELYTITQIEPSEVMQVNLLGQALFNGFYLNELLMRLLHKHDPFPTLFQHYQTAITELSQNNTHEIALRIFEKNLLSCLGYGLSLQQEAEFNSEIRGESNYIFEIERGFIKMQLAQINNPFIFRGQSLLDFHNDHLTDKQSLYDAKRLMRMVLGNLLGDKPLQTRQMLQQINRKITHEA